LSGPDGRIDSRSAMAPLQTVVREGVNYFTTLCQSACYTPLVVFRTRHNQGVFPMRIRMLMGAVLVAAVPASAQETALEIALLPGHPIYHEREHEAGVAMALSITPGEHRASDLVTLCEELRVTAELAHKRDGGLRLETIFVVPYKGMVVEGYYWPNDRARENGVLVPGSEVARAALDGIVARAGLPPRVLDETDVQHEISCSLGEPLWFVAWYDVRPIGDKEPDAVIEQARDRFLAIHRSVVEHGKQQLQTAQGATRRG
jgi:hypothetical protein